MVKKPDAKQSQEFFFLSGTNITFTYTNNRVIINGSPGTNMVTSATNAVYSAFATNWYGSNVIQTQITAVSNQLVTTSNSLQGQINASAGVCLTNLDTRGWTNYTGIYGNGVGLTNVDAFTLHNTNAFIDSFGVADFGSVTVGPFTVDNFGDLIANSLTGNGVGLTNIQFGALPTGILTNNWNGPRVTLTNSSLLVTGAQYIALSNGTAKVLLTNGTLTTSGGITVGAASSFIGNITMGGVTFLGSSRDIFNGRNVGSTAINPVWNSTGTGGRIEWTNSGGRLLYDGTNGNLLVSGSFTATNGVAQIVKISFFTNFTAVSNIQAYCVSGTNQVITMPDTTNTTVGVIYRFSSTNGYGSYTLQTAQADQSIRQSGVTTFTQIGIGESGWWHDGKNWWPASKSRLVMPSAQFSCSTNITLTAANTAYPITLNSTDFNNSQGIALLAGTNGLLSKMWITNSGVYEFTPSLVINYSGAHTVRMWFRSNGTNIPNSCTMIAGAASDISVMTVPFIVNVTTPTPFEMWVESTSILPSASFIQGAAASGNYPAAPSVICPVKRISDPWP